MGIQLGPVLCTVAKLIPEEYLNDYISVPSFILGPRSNVCYSEGKSYDIGATFISADCKSRCTCQGHDNVNCVSLCPPLMVKCKPNEEMKHTDEPAQPGSKCTCKTPVCVPSKI